ncbi:MAG: transporter substrate-binding domain-containing protein [Rhizobiales bacterium]|nr:transporter substrate-binding domain-containing protein [Hyphomicrobiales bacterium]
MRRLLVLTAILIATLSAELQTAAAATLDRIRSAGVFRIGYRADAKPYSYRNEKGQPAGYVVDLCREVAHALGPKIRAQYILVPADQRFEAIRDGRIDILCDPTSVTIQRREIVDFSAPTFVDGASVISRSSKPVRRFEDLAGKRIGVLDGTTSQHTLRESLDELNLSCRRADGRVSRSAGLISAMRPMPWPCPVTTAHSGSWLIGRSPASIARAGSPPSWKRPSARRRSTTYCGL